MQYNRYYIATDQSPLSFNKTNMIMKFTVNSSIIVLVLQLRVGESNMNQSGMIHERCKNDKGLEL